ncbi:non-classical arabinogalactan protein 30-like [Argentina anserina]|uniref:non-classical arabinogalactan protein 30-like n=1 Tax=Argentina anserina TaxID=57926 RepID=UPI0021762560|nr:non-classical arabinogalactan protein 30-like [Potentilla anserina]
MAGRQLIVLVSSLLLASLAFFPSTTAIEYQKKIEVVVEGMVYCQSCDHYGTWSMTGAKPIPSAKVSVICKNHNKQVSFYKAFQTNADGYFYAPLDGFKMNHIMDHPLQACHVKPVSSPLQDCRFLSNINHGLDGAPLRYEDKRVMGNNYEAVVYSAGPLAFRPANCAPKTHF